MRLEGKYKFDASQEKVWEVLTNPKHLEKAIPGCEKLQESGPNKYDALLKVGIAAVKGTFTGKFEVADPVPPQQYKLVGEGSGSSGFVKGEAVIQLTAANGHTLVDYHGEMHVGGLIAGVGQRMLGGIAKMMLNQFFKRMSNELKSSK
jgi:uncharacterized protein